MPATTISVRFVREWGDHPAGANASLPDALARHLVDAGLAAFVDQAPAVAEPAERADAARPRNVQRATK